MTPRERTAAIWRWSLLGAAFGAVLALYQNVLPWEGRAIAVNIGAAAGGALGGALLANIACRIWLSRQ